MGSKQQEVCEGMPMCLFFRPFILPNRPPTPPTQYTGQPRTSLAPEAMEQAQQALIDEDYTLADEVMWGDPSSKE